jgi:RNA polymerase sigma-70 factor, ECF subfamily
MSEYLGSIVKPGSDLPRMQHKPSRASDLWAVGQISDDEVDRLVCLTYDELKRLAARFLSEERRDHTLQPTALVHEAYLSLVKQVGVKWQNKSHFLTIAARAMRRILVDHARNRARLKRGGTQQKISLEQISIFSIERSADLVAVDQSLTRLAEIDPREAEIVELRFYGGLSVEETAEALNLSPITVKRDWKLAKAWLYGDLKEQYEAEAGTVGTSQDPL